LNAAKKSQITWDEARFPVSNDQIGMDELAANIRENEEDQEETQFLEAFFLFGASLLFPTKNVIKNYRLKIKI